MSTEGLQAPPSRALLALAPIDTNWQPILSVSNQVVLYNPTSHALSIKKSSQQAAGRARPRACLYCKQPLPPDFEYDSDTDVEIDSPLEEIDPESNSSARVPNYFQLLEIANETSSRPSSPHPQTRTNDDQNRAKGGGGGAFAAEAMASGYFKAFFQEECRLGMGAYGSVFLCQHMLDGNPLGHFAVKKIAVGESHTYLLQILREVRLLERLHHPNIITYHHAWLETTQFSAFGPKVPTLHVLMQWAEGGSLDDFIDLRLGRKTHLPHMPPPSSSRISETNPNLTDDSSPTTPTQSDNDLHSRSARIRAFRAFQRAPPQEREKMRSDMNERNNVGVNGQKSPSWKAVHLMSAEEVRSLFGDIVEGLAFLHDKSILHLDLKPGNVLLTWDEDRLIPRAMLSDFGTSRDMLHSSRARSGNTGTLEYTSPESLPSPHTGLLQQVDSKADMWSLGMILHKLLFFRLPYRYAEEPSADSEVEEGEKMTRLEYEIQSYSGFKPTSTLVAAFEARRLPRAYLVLLESLLNVNPSARPTCERVLNAIREGRLDPVVITLSRDAGSLIPAHRRSSQDSSEHSDTVPDATAQTSYPDEKKAMSPLVEKRAPLLKLLAPPRVSVDSGGNVSVYTPPTTGDFGSISIWIPRKAWVKVMKSAILLAKIMSVVVLCPHLYLRPYFVGLMFFVAVMDTWFDGLRISAALALLHAVLLQLGR